MPNYYFTKLNIYILCQGLCKDYLTVTDVDKYATIKKHVRRPIFVALFFFFKNKQASMIFNNVACEHKKTNYYFAGRGEMCFLCTYILLLFNQHY